MTTTLELWDKVRRVPAEHLTQFNNGKFNGTAIKPMWTIKAMTEQFGPMGTGWGVLHHDFRIEPAGESRLVFCDMAVWYGTRDQIVFGIGGDWLVRNGKGDDEALKKAYTDALTNALKHLGVAADIHMGLWDGNKYVDEAPEPHPAPAPAKPQTFEKSPIVKEAYKVIDTWLNKIGNTGTLEDLQTFWIDNQDTIKSLPADWKKELTAKKDEIKEALKGKVAA